MMADKVKISRLIKTARGQLEGILTMVEDDRYCIDISNQLMSANAIIKKANKEILTAHLMSCVKNAKTEEDIDEKLKELTETIDKLL